MCHLLRLARRYVLTVVEICSVLLNVCENQRYCSSSHQWMISLSVCRHSFNEEPDLLTFLQKGPSSTSMGSPWKPFLLLSVISGLSGKKFKRQCSKVIVRNTDIRSNSTVCIEIYRKDMSVVNVTQLGESSFMDVRGGLSCHTWRR